MIQRLQRCNRRIGEHIPRGTSFTTNGLDLSIAEKPVREAIRKEISEYLELSGSKCLDYCGIELGAHHKSAVIFQDGEKEPAWAPEKYISFTYAGSCAPHVFLKDGKTSVLDKYGPEWSFVAFVEGDETSTKWVIDDNELGWGICPGNRNASKDGYPTKQEAYVWDLRSQSCIGACRRACCMAWSESSRSGGSEGYSDGFHWGKALSQGMLLLPGGPPILAAWDKLSAKDFLGLGKQVSVRT